MLLFGASLACLAPVASAATVEDAAARLADTLQRKVDILAGVKDAASAASAVQPLQSVLTELGAVGDMVPESELWNYIDSTEDVKPKLVGLVQSFSKQFTRLEKADFYGCEPLRLLLAPQLNGGAEQSAAE